jgi:hypothetical protein
VPPGANAQPLGPFALVGSLPEAPTVRIQSKKERKDRSPEPAKKDSDNSDKRCDDGSNPPCSHGGGDDDPTGTKPGKELRKGKDK